MNRQLKFRVWTEITMEYNIMVGHLGAFYCSGMDSEDEASLSSANTKYGEVNPIMQFTGLKDCQGQEVYEGDIVFIDEDFWMVVFEEGLFGLKFDEEDKVSPLYQYPDCCVHGNIFENKELLHG